MPATGAQRGVIAGMADRRDDPQRRTAGNPEFLETIVMIIREIRRSARGRVKDRPAASRAANDASGKGYLGWQNPHRT